MKMRRSSGLTLMEVLVGVTVIAVFSAITFVGLRAWRGYSLQSSCMAKLSRINEALMFYRSEWGNPHEVVGSTVQLGLPLHRLVGRVPSTNETIVEYTLLPEHMPRFGKTFDERDRAFSCPQFPHDGPFTVYGYFPGSPFADEDWIFPYSSVTRVLKGDSPVVFCLNHNGPNTLEEDRNEQYVMLTLTLGGAVRREFIRGVLMIRWRDVGAGVIEFTFANFGEMIEYIRLQDPEGFEREWKFQQERRRRRR